MTVCMQRKCKPAFIYRHLWRSTWWQKLWLLQLPECFTEILILNNLIKSEYNLILLDNMQNYLGKCTVSTFSIHRLNGVVLQGISQSLKSGSLVMTSPSFTEEAIEISNKSLHRGQRFRHEDWSSHLWSSSTQCCPTLLPHTDKTSTRTQSQLKLTTPRGRQTQCQGQDLLNQPISLLLRDDPTCQLSCHYIHFSLSVWIHKPFHSSRSGPHNDRNVSKVNRWLK